METYVYEVVSNDFHDLPIHTRSHGLFRDMDVAKRKVKDPTWVIATDELGGEDWILKSTEGSQYGDSWYYLFQSTGKDWGTGQNSVPLGSLEVWINKREVK